MKRFTSFMEVEALCAAMIRDYSRASGRGKALCVDIEGFVTEYLGMPVVYETFAEEEPGRIGFCSDGMRPLAVRRRGRTERVVFPARTAVIEKGLLRPGRAPGGGSPSPTRAPTTSCCATSPSSPSLWPPSGGSTIRTRCSRRNW